MKDVKVSGHPRDRDVMTNPAWLSACFLALSDWSQSNFQLSPPAQAFSVWPHPGIIFPTHPYPLCLLILPQDLAPSRCLQRWHLSSCVCCPGWHELMITAQASQTRLIHYITWAGLLRIHTLLTLNAQHCIALTLLFYLLVLCCCIQHMVQCVQYTHPYGRVPGIYPHPVQWKTYFWTQKLTCRATVT